MFFIKFLFLIISRNIPSINVTTPIWYIVLFPILPLAGNWKYALFGNNSSSTIPVSSFFIIANAGGSFSPIDSIFISTPLFIFVISAFCSVPEVSLSVLFS